METLEGFRTRLAIAHAPDRRLDLILEFMSRPGEYNPGMGRDLATEATQIAVKLRAFDALARVPLYDGIAFCRAGVWQDAIQSLLRAFELLRDLHLHADMADAALYLGHAYRALHRYESADKWYGRALELAAQDVHAVARARVLEALGEMSLEIGRWDKALECLMQALRLYEEYLDSARVVGCLVALASIYALTKDTSRALEALRRALAVSQAMGDKYGEVNILSRLAGILRQCGQLDIALEHSLTALTIYEALGDRANAGATLMTIGAIHEDLGKLESALQFYLKAHDTLDSNSGDERLNGAVLHSIGRLYRESGDMADAQLLLEHALITAQRVNDRHLQSQIHESLALTHERLGDLHRALEHHRNFARIKEDLAGEQKQKEIAALQVRFDVEKAERERELYQVKAERLESEMKQKERELAAMALNRVQMNQLVDVLKSKIGNLEAGVDMGNGSIVQRILHELDTSSGSEEAWEGFERRLDNIHHEYIRKLSERYPSLSPTELKICSLLKINLSTKEIAALLCIADRTVEAHRFNIGKKMNLNKGVRLANFLSGI